MAQKIIVDKGLSPICHLIIARINQNFLSSKPLSINIREIRIKIKQFSFEKHILKWCLQNVNNVVQWLGAVEQQAITWTSLDVDCWCNMAAMS